MPYIQWTKDFELGIHEFDQHHKQFAGLLNRIYDDFISGSRTDVVRAVVDELRDYTAFHFAAEEYWMRTNAYPGLPQHRDEHKRFSSKVHELQTDFLAGDTNLSLEVLQFLNNWLVNHILKTDAEYAHFEKQLPKITP